MNRTITIKGIGKLSLKPDQTVVSLMLKTVHADYDKAMDEAAKHLEHLYSPTRYEMEADCLMKISAAPTAMDIEPDDIDVSDSVTFVWEIR